MCENFFNEIKNEEKNINEQIFNYCYLSFLVKNLYQENQTKNDKIVKTLMNNLLI